MPVYLIRHCKKEEDRKLFPVDDETPLSAEGRQQLPGLAAALREEIDRHGHGGKCVLITSAQTRHQETADGILPALADLNIVREVDPRLAELSRGKFYPLTEAERRELFPAEAQEYYRLKSPETRFGMLTAKAPDGEDIHDVSQRINGVLRDVKRRFSPQDTVILVTSNCPERLLAAELSGKGSLWYLKEAPPPYGGIRVFEGRSWSKMQDKGFVHPADYVHPTNGRDVSHVARITSARSQKRETDSQIHH